MNSAFKLTKKGLTLAKLIDHRHLRTLRPPPNPNVNALAVSAASLPPPSISLSAALVKQRETPEPSCQFIFSQIRIATINKTITAFTDRRTSPTPPVEESPSLQCQYATDACPWASLEFEEVPCFWTEHLQVRSLWLWQGCHLTRYDEGIPSN
jgi:hypothetical protein